MAVLRRRARRALLALSLLASGARSYAPPPSSPPPPLPPPPPQSLAGKVVAVVGGGVGGLVTAGLLARRGARVTVFERRGVAGGRLGEARLGPAGEWRFDTGPSLLLMPEVYAEVRALA